MILQGLQCNLDKEGRLGTTNLTCNFEEYIVNNLSLHVKMQLGKLLVIPLFLVIKPTKRFHNHDNHLSIVTYLHISGEKVRSKVLLPLNFYLIQMLIYFLLLSCPK